MRNVAMRVSHGYHKPFIAYIAYITYNHILVCLKCTSQVFKYDVVLNS